MRPREVFGLWVGQRHRHMDDTGNVAEAERDYLLARHLFPTSRKLYVKGTWVSIRRSTELFETNEEGTPASLAEFIAMHYGTGRFYQPEGGVCTPGSSTDRAIR